MHAEARVACDKGLQLSTCSVGIQAADSQTLSRLLDWGGGWGEEGLHVNVVVNFFKCCKWKSCCIPRKLFVNSPENAIDLKRINTRVIADGLLIFARASKKNADSIRRMLETCRKWPGLRTELCRVKGLPWMEDLNQAALGKLAWKVLVNEDCLSLKHLIGKRRVRSRLKFVHAAAGWKSLLNVRRYAIYC
ncbi:hypothetical protein Ancab_002903 [Ancistrocladus abbreviatus]